MLNNVPDSKIKWFVDSLLDWGKSNFVDYPWRSCTSPIHQLIAEIFLQRTRASQVVPVFSRMVMDYPDIENLSQLSENDWVEIIHSLGLHWRALPLHKLVQTLKKNFEGEIPEDIDQLRMLPGVGDYVSSAYLSLHRNKWGFIVDSNVVRVYGRFFSFSYDGETRRKKWLLVFAERLTPKKNFKSYNYALLDFAMKICKQKPRCDVCPLKQHCNSLIVDEPTSTPRR